MLVRMFELRGLEKLYQSGFGGLMVALEEFEGGWIKGGSVSKKLVSFFFFFPFNLRFRKKDLGDEMGLAISWICYCRLSDQSQLESQ